MATAHEDIARQCVKQTLPTIQDEDILEYIISVVADWETFEDADGLADMLAPLLVRPCSSLVGLMAKYLGSVTICVKNDGTTLLIMS